MRYQIYIIFKDYYADSINQSFKTLKAAKEMYLSLIDETVLRSGIVDTVTGKDVFN